MTTANNYPLEVGPDVKPGSILPAVVETLEHDNHIYRCIFGVRLDDEAGVMHFYRHDGAPWLPDFNLRLQRAVEGTLDVRAVSLGYAADVDSFYVIVGGLGKLEDPYVPMETVLAKLDEQLGL